MIDNLLAFLIAGFSLTGSPGPATLSCAACGAAFGPRPSLGYVIGVIAGVWLVIGLTASGVIGLVLALPGAAILLTGLAAAYMTYLAYRIATAPPLGSVSTQTEIPSFAGGFILSIANPKAYAAMAALFSGFVLLPDRVVWDATAKIGVLLVMTSLVNVTWLFIGSALTRFSHNPRLGRAINIGFAVLLLASVALALLL